jgi:hypothetical protein
MLPKLCRSKRFIIQGVLLGCHHHLYSIMIETGWQSNTKSTVEINLFRGCSLRQSCTPSQSHCVTLRRKLFGAHPPRAKDIYDRQTESSIETITLVPLLCLSSPPPVTRASVCRGGQREKRDRGRRREEGEGRKEKGGRIEDG